MFKTTYCFIFSMLFILIFNLIGCRKYTMIVMENPEFSDDMLPSDLDESILEKYSVGDVVAQPRLHYEDSAQTKFKLLLVVFSKVNTQEVAISDLTISVNGNKIEYGTKIIDRFVSGWEMYPANKPYYVCSISGEPINQPKEEMINSRINISLEVTAKNEEGDASTKKIDVYFSSKKQSFIE